MQQEITGIGLMSGTSLDGLDIACCKFVFTSEKIEFSLLDAHTSLYNDFWRKNLAEAQMLSGLNLTLLHHEFGVYCGEQVNHFLKEKKYNIDFIASHGHTVFHQPEKGISLQIGSGATIAAVTNITTVCDFRSLDVALGGQGAPLVPIGDEHLFSEYNACLNLGGIANISFRKNKERIAFDICAVNIVLNELSAKLGMLYDRNGEVAASGNMAADLLQQLNEHPFYNLKEKKSIGREWIEENVLRLIEISDNTSQDKLRTFTEHVATQIARVIQENNLNRVLVTGGGAYNRFLIERMQQLSDAEFILPAPRIIEFKEAIIFALLGALRIKNKINTLKSVTGANRDSCGGAIYPGR